MSNQSQEVPAMSSSSAQVQQMSASSSSTPAIGKQRRYRKAVSCSNCRLKKVKCDRSSNCSSCRVRGETCVWEDGAVPKQEPDVNLEAEVARLNDTVAVLTNRIDVLERLLSMRVREDFMAEDQLPKDNKRKRRHSRERDGERYNSSFSSPSPCASPLAPVQCPRSNMTRMCDVAPPS
ncbi:hypothetical protein BT69DRAFT_1346464 [Atractiella rhizophila]|nr:hypothetical protein BT69DRAFT_1346464 [Atractiella rhizophila]